MTNNQAQVRIYVESYYNTQKEVGAYKYHLCFKDIQKEFVVTVKDSTCNEIYMLGVIEAFSKLKRPCDVVLTVVNKPFMNAIKNQWLTKWVDSNWKKPIANKELWQKFVEYEYIHNISYQEI